MYIPKYFTPKECFPKEIAPRDTNQFDTRNWRRFSPEILVSADQLRDDYGVMTGNEGVLNGCGFRLPLKEGSNILYDIDGLSDHFFGRALDLHPKETTAERIRRDIVMLKWAPKMVSKKHPIPVNDRYPFITFLEIDINWLHIAYRNNYVVNNDMHMFNPMLDGRLELWSPVRGFVDWQEYLETGDLK